MAYIHEGVYGDHSTDGWLEWGLDEYYANKRLEEVEQGKSNAEEALNQAARFVVEATSTHELRRAQMLYGIAGLYAAQEARSQGYKINGWDEKPSSSEPPVAEREDIPLNVLKETPEDFKGISKLASNWWLEQLASDKNQPT